MRGAIALTALVLLAAGCDASLYELASENTVDPSVAAPKAEVFASLTGITVTWDQDSNADGYVLYRRIVSSSTADVVYQGTELSYLDTTALPDTMYAYTLAKTRGHATFPQGGQSLGAWDPNYVQDPNGLNDSRDAATGVTYDTVSDRVFYYSAIDATTNRQGLISDTDWYYVDLGPRLQVHLSMNYSVVSQNQYLIVTTTTDLNPSNAAEFCVFNPDTSAQRIYFNVHFNPAVASTSTQTRVDYQLQYLNTAPYNPTN